MLLSFIRQEKDWHQDNQIEHALFCKAFKVFYQKNADVCGNITHAQMFE